MHEKTPIGNRYRHKANRGVYHAVAISMTTGVDIPDDGSVAFFRIWRCGDNAFDYIETGPRSLGEGDYLVLEIELTIQRSGPTTIMADWLIYQSNEGSFYARPLAEFNDGRFEKIRRKNR